jgi:glycoside/pentoside/hexuronide:cation symporter, GPH family
VTFSHWAFTSVIEARGRCRRAVARPPWICPPSRLIKRRAECAYRLISGAMPALSGRVGFVRHRILPQSLVTMKPNSQKLRLAEKMGYGAGDFASCLFWQTFSIYLAVFYTDIFGLSPTAVATMLLITRTWDLFYDPVMGVIADRTTSRWGRFRPYLLWVPIPLGVVAVFTFSTPDFSVEGKLVYAYVTYGLLMLLYSTVNVPYAAMLGVITTNPKDRIGLSSWRMLGAFAGSSFVTYCNYGLSYYFSVADARLGQALQLTITSLAQAFSTETQASVDALQKIVITPEGYRSTVMVYAVLAALVFGLTFYLTRERVTPKPPGKGSWKQDLADLVKNYPWMILVGVTILKNSFAGVRGGMIYYYFKYYVHNEALSGSYLLFGSLASIASIYLVQYLPVAWGKKMPYMVSIAFAGVFSAMSYWVGPKDYTAMFVYQVLTNFFMGPPNSMLWSMYADTADYSEHRTGRRATGLIFSASGMSQKLGWTVASSLGLYILGYFAFQANVEQPIETLDGIKLVVSMVPAACCFLAAAIMGLYPLTAKRMTQIEADLTAMRQKETAGAT